jgi:hypothetical protein
VERDPHDVMYRYPKGRLDFVSVFNIPVKGESI